MAGQSVEDAMIIIQEASTSIAQVSTNLQSNNDGVLAAIKDLSNKVSQLEKSSQSPSSPQLQAKPPLYIRVSGTYI